MSLERIVLLVGVAAFTLIFCVFLWKLIGNPIRKWLWALLKAWKRWRQAPSHSILVGLSVVSDQNAEAKLWLDDGGGAQLLQSFFMNTGDTFNFSFADGGIIVPDGAHLSLCVPYGVRVMANPLWRGAPARFLVVETT